MREVRLEAYLFEQLDYPTPPIGGFEDYRASRLETTKQRSELSGVVYHVAVEQLVTFLIDHRHFGAMTVHVQTDIERTDLLWSMESPK
jgi:hypothetical protein